MDEAPPMTCEDEEFSQFFKEHFPSLRRFLECLLGAGRGNAEELAQEAFTKLYHIGFASFPPGEARFWLFRVARNLALNELNKGQTRRRLFGIIVESFKPASSNPERDYEIGERREILEKLLGTLPEAQRSALLLREHEGMSYIEISRVLGVTESKVKVDIHRARTSLRASWEKAEARSASAARG